MKRTSIFLFFAVVLGISPLMAQTKAPSISFDSPTRDFGRVTEGQVLKCVFGFSNRGQAPLEIFKVESS